MQMNNARFVVIFTSKLNPNAQEYSQWGAQMEALVIHQEGYVSHRSFRNENGQGVTLSYWESLDAIRAWQKHPLHLQAQAYGKKEAYLDYTLEVCEIKRVSSFVR